MSRPLISYVVTVYNKAPYLRDLVQSILAQPIRPIEIVFSDDASQDGSTEFLREFANNPGDGEVSVRLILETTNKGPSSAINLGIREATGEWIHFIDADDVLTPGASGIMLKSARENGSDFIYGGKTSIEKSKVKKHASAQLERRYEDAMLGLIQERLVGIRFFCTRELALVGADERIFIQDVSLPYRIAYYATSLTVLDTPVVKVRDVESSISKNKLQEHADYLGAAALFVSEFDVARQVRTRIVRRCLGRIRQTKSTGKYLLWEFLSVVGMAPSKPIEVILKEFLRLHDVAQLRQGRAFAEIQKVRN